MQLGINSVRINCSQPVFSLCIQAKLWYCKLGRSGQGVWDHCRPHPDKSGRSGQGLRDHCRPHPDKSGRSGQGVWDHCRPHPYKSGRSGQGVGITVDLTQTNQVDLVKVSYCRPQDKLSGRCLGSL